MGPDQRFLGVLDTSPFRIAIVYSIVFACGAAALLGVVYFAVSRVVDGSTDNLIEAEVQGLREQMVVRMRPWLDFTEALIQRFVAGSPLASLVDVRAAAGAVLALYVGMDLLIHLDGDRSRATAMFDAGERLAATVAPLFGGDG